MITSPTASRSSLELQYNFPRKSLRLLIRCAEHHPKGEGLKQLNKLKLDPL